MGEKEISVDFTELNRLEAYCCPSCKTTGILVDMSDTAAPVPSECPGCRKDLPQHVITAIKAYRQFFENAQQSKARLNFRVKET